MMINFAAPSLITKNLVWPARVVALILLSVYRFVHVTHGTLITLIYHLIDSFRIWEPESVNPSQTSIFITGCASGFGLSLAYRLDQLGYHVFAGVRVLDERAAKLKSSCSHRLRLVRCDVADRNSIQEAYNFIRENLQDTHLYAVVNNAGVVRVMPFEWRQDDQNGEAGEVAINLMAPMHISRIFLPLLRQTPGSRILFVSSLAGRFPLFACSAYCASKAGLTAFATCLSRELRHQNVFVSVVEPGSYETPLNNHDYSSIGSAFASLPPHMRDVYQDEFFAEFELDKKMHALSTSVDHEELTDQLVRSCISRGPPDLLVCVTSIRAFLSVLTVECLPTDLLLKIMRGVTRFLHRLGILTIDSNLRE